MDRKNSVVFCCEHRKDLLERKSDEQDSAHNKQGDDGAAIPVVQHASKVDTHDQAYDGADAKDRAQEIELYEAILKGQARAGVEGRKDKEVDRCKNGCEKD